MGPADSDGISRVPPYSGLRCAQTPCPYGAVTLYGAAFLPPPVGSLVRCRGPTTPRRPCDRRGLGCSPFARHYWGNHMLFSLPAGTKMFQFPALASRKSGIRHECRGLSHSEIPGSMAICASPGLIAAYHVLRRLREPRHPPCALTYFARYSFYCSVERPTQHIAGKGLSIPPADGHRHSHWTVVASFLFVLTTVLCANKSKIDSQTTADRAGWEMWRITDSNR